MSWARRGLKARAVVHSLAHIQWNLHLDAVGMRPPPTRHTLTTLRGRRRHRKRTTARVQWVLKKFQARARRHRCRYIDRQRHVGFGRRRLVMCHVAKKNALSDAARRGQRPPPRGHTSCLRHMGRAGTTSHPPTMFVRAAAMTSALRGAARAFTTPSAAPGSRCLVDR